MIRALSLSACVLLLAAGCSAGPAPRTYLLDPPLQYAAAPAAVPAGPLIQVPTVTLPDYLDTEDILLREGAHGLAASPAARWGERLSAGVTHALMAALVNRLPDYRVSPARPPDPLARQILVDVTAFDVGRDGRCELRASWSITTPGAVSTALGRQAVFVTPAAGASRADAAAV
ncbi:MAG TPA: PqiC family protein, partial [Steroidobacteraceae bacterium]|nr:PqiC family protein [Steroidobacteraceae bacterium]